MFSYRYIHGPNGADGPYCRRMGWCSDMGNRAWRLTNKTSFKCKNILGKTNEEVQYSNLGPENFITCSKLPNTFLTLDDDTNRKDTAVDRPMTCVVIAGALVRIRASYALCARM